MILMIYSTFGNLKTHEFFPKKFIFLLFYSAIDNRFLFIKKKFFLVLEYFTEDEYCSFFILLVSHFPPPLHFY